MSVIRDVIVALLRPFVLIDEYSVKLYCKNCGNIGRFIIVKTISVADYIAYYKPTCKRCGIQGEMRISK